MHGFALQASGTMLLLVILSLPVAAQEPASRAATSGGAIPIGLSQGPALTPEQRAAIQAEILENRAQLRARGALASEAEAAGGPTVSFGWPLQAAAGYTDPGYHGISGFVDHDAAFPGSLQDYECGTRTYDTAGGYNHSGVDIHPYPFTWNKMDAGAVEIIAAAPGTIVYKNDGEFDRSCANNNNLWNAVYIEHADGTVAWYGHMKNGSVTSKAVGLPVVQGEVLGLVGSSGNSSNPHLHFEVQDSAFNLLDPYAGTCNPVSSLWSSQRPYYDSAINKLATQSAPPVFDFCDGPEIENLKDVFAPGDDIYFAAYYRDQRLTQSTTFTVYRPDDSVFATWSHTPTIDFWVTEWDFLFSLPGNAPTGTWRVEADFEGVTTTHFFEVLVSVPALSHPALLVLPALLALAAGWGLRGRWSRG